jgi:hypothetical protein
MADPVLAPTASHNEEAFHHITKQRKQIASIRTAAGSEFASAKTTLTLAGRSNTTISLTKTEVLTTKIQYP